MPLITDIPERDGLDGAAQLALLRSYLKDLVVPYKFPDTLLIPLLVVDTRVTVWRNITGEAVTALPWTYDPLTIQDPITRIRVLTGDTNEGSLSYTDAELWRMLDVIPLRYVVIMINAKVAGLNTYPADKNNPITIMRDYLEDVTVITPKYTDAQLVDMIIDSGFSPHGLVLTILENNIAIDSSSQLLSSGGELASLDGITFSSPSEALTQKNLNKGSVSTAYMNSPYWKEDVAAWYVDGVNVTERDWEVRWYAI
ncbi:virion-associated protein [Shewanella phage vB_SspS_KASIA]|nr:virion-associated protein [Shewanella phage vB_SspS_KASIA]